ncbi:uncharacterized protein LOC114318487 [Camellia sinensis]|uniref:DUF3741 domain-containing protein n=1 Tax=Camellia sinensis var. sinensis TaxID=542762 RepID=A0A4V6RY10_CAMSN|nr:uncharacterized protein LOC114318487 [Camellia sinensis]THF95646.1 hypothetical protein TEA_015256 [Camellia sinensis var. sinensis]
MTNSQNSTSKCFSGILRRLLCTGNLPTHPSDLIIDPTTTFENSKNDFKTQVKTPGVVARLMGLDSLPHLNLVPKDSSILRSRSVNSVNYFPDFDPTRSHHRRVRTSLSFREVPTFLQQQQQPKKQNLDFFVLCLEKVGGNGGNKMGLSSDIALKDLKQQEMKTERSRENLSETKFENKRKVFRRKEDQPNKLCRNCSLKVDNVNLDRKNKVVVVQRQARESLIAKKSGVKNVNQKKTKSELKIGNKKKSRNNMAKKVQQSVCVLENLSPVSVLDLHHESTSGHTNVTISNSRSSNVANNDSNNPSSNYTRNFIADEHHVIKAKNRDDKEKQTSETQYYDVMLTQILRLTEKGIEETHWVNEKVIEFEDIEEICTVFGQQILDFLFHQVVDELVLCNMNKLAL